MKFFTAFSLAALVVFITPTSSSRHSRCSSIEVRKEWRTLTKAERKAWIDAANCLNKVPRTGKLNPPIDTASYSDPAFQIPPQNENSTYYDELVYAHMNLNPVIHWTGLFFPWHRVYLHEWTNALRSRCGYKGIVPYWAWEKGMNICYSWGDALNLPTWVDASDVLGSAIWDTDPESGLGGFSDNEADDYTIHTGGLKISVAYPVPHNLRRHYIPYPFGNNISAASTFTPAEVDRLLSLKNFTAFQGFIESGMHGSIHLMMGGDMGTICPAGSFNTSACLVQRTATYSSNEPMFHLHHGNVDRLWWLWQEKSNANKFDFHGGSIQNRSSLDIYPNEQAPWLNKSSPVPSAGMWDT
ncbi:hypothetical protein CTheo_3416 [Ceratobasidium theobromae]|uniref:Tyrosinase copper-binding domain-containing protein n=1 Tax=Ceratobasidium theobromae TaxID=1582974 RepID=A0A5N5QN45_9AGAM|nr:hypothetical protein CTheo_3416 [Ceratobasidium theobromae]